MGHRLIQVHLKLLPTVIYTLLRFPLILLILLILFNTPPPRHSPTSLGVGGLFSHLHLTLNKYFPRSFILFTFVHQIIFLYTKSSFIFGHPIILPTLPERELAKNQAHHYINRSNKTAPQQKKKTGNSATSKTTMCKGILV
jgi:predicted membrane protein